MSQKSDESVESPQELNRRRKLPDISREINELTDSSTFVDNKNLENEKHFKFLDLDQNAESSSEIVIVPSITSEDCQTEKDEQNKEQSHEDGHQQMEFSTEDDHSETMEDLLEEHRSSNSDTDTDNSDNNEGSYLPNFEIAPKHRWRADKVMRTREIGSSTKFGSEWFPYSFMGGLHSVQRFELMYKLSGHEGCVNCLSFNGQGTKLASGSDDTNVVVWDWAANKQLVKFHSGHVMNVFQARFVPMSGDCHLVTCARDGQVRLAELSVCGVCKSTRKLAKHQNSAHKLALHENSPHVFLSCGEDAVVFEIDLRTAKANKILTARKPGGGRKIPLYSINTNPLNCAEFCISGRDSHLRIFDRRYIRQKNEPLKSFRPHHLSLTHPANDPNITAAVYNYNGSELLASYNDDYIYTFDTSHSDGADCTHQYMGHRNNQTVKGVNYYGPKSEFIVSGSDCGNVFLWEHDSEKIVHLQQGDEAGVVNVLESHPYASVLATSGLDNDVKIWIPSNENPRMDVHKVRKVIGKNRRLRERDMRHPDADPDFIYAMLRRIVRNRRIRHRSPNGQNRELSGENVHSDSGNDEAEEDEEDIDVDDDDDDEEEQQDRHDIRVAQCRTS